MKPILLALSVMAAVSLPVAGGFGVRLTQAAPAAQTPHTCRNTQLLVRYKSSNGAAGHIMVIYRMHNLSGRACTMYGYPGVELLDRNFATLPTRVVRGGSFINTIPARRVQVGPHGDAFFTLVYSDVPVGNRPCQAPAKYLMIWAPNNFLPVVTYASSGGGSMMACTGTVNVSPVTSHPTF